MGRPAYRRLGCDCSEARREIGIDVNGYWFREFYIVTEIASKFYIIPISAFLVSFFSQKVSYPSATWVTPSGMEDLY